MFAPQPGRRAPQLRRENRRCEQLAPAARPSDDRRAIVVQTSGLAASLVQRCALRTARAVDVPWNVGHGGQPGRERDLAARKGWRSQVRPAVFIFAGASGPPLSLLPFPSMASRLSGGLSSFF